MVLRGIKGAFVTNKRQQGLLGCQGVYGDEEASKGAPLR